MNTNQPPQEEQTNFGMPARLFDGYDGGNGQEPPPEFMQQLLDRAPPEIRARAEEWARQRAQAGAQQGEENQQPVAQD